MGYRLENIKQPSVKETSEGHARPSTETKEVKTESPTVTASLSWELWKFNQVVNFIYWYAEISYKGVNGMNFSLFVVFVIVVHCAQRKRYLQYIVNDKHNRISEIFDTYSLFASFSPLWCRTGRFKDFTLPIDIKRGILTHLKKTLILGQLINLTLISSQPWNQP